MKLSENYLVKHVLDSDILVDIKNNFSGVIKLNKTAVDTIECINKGMDTNQIIDYLIDKYDIDKQTLSNDVNCFINDCINKGIIIDEK